MTLTTTPTDTIQLLLSAKIWAKISNNKTKEVKNYYALQSYDLFSIWPIYGNGYLLFISRSLKKFLSFSGALAQIYQTSCPDWQSYRYRICLNCSRDFYLESQVDSPLSWPPFILNLNQTTKHTNKKQTYVWKQKWQNSRLKMLLSNALLNFDPDLNFKS